MNFRLMLCCVAGRPCYVMLCYCHVMLCEGKVRLYYVMLFHVTPFLSLNHFSATCFSSSFLYHLSSFSSHVSPSFFLSLSLFLLFLYFLLPSSPSFHVTSTPLFPQSHWLFSFTFLLSLSLPSLPKLLLSPSPSCLVPPLLLLLKSLPCLTSFRLPSLIDSLTLWFSSLPSSVFLSYSSLASYSSAVRSSIPSLSGFISPPSWLTG